MEEITLSLTNGAQGKWTSDLRHYIYFKTQCARGLSVPPVYMVYMAACSPKSKTEDQQTDGERQHAV